MKKKTTNRENENARASKVIQIERGWGRWNEVEEEKNSETKSNNGISALGAEVNFDVEEPKHANRNQY